MLHPRLAPKMEVSSVMSSCLLVQPPHSVTAVTNPLSAMESICHMIQGGVVPLLSPSTHSHGM